MSIFEALMMLCFGASWPFQVAKTYKTKCVAGKSRLFLWLLLAGYVFGIIHKLLHNLDIVVWLYVLNLCLVSIDLFLCYKYRNIQPTA